MRGFSNATPEQSGRASQLPGHGRVSAWVYTSVQAKASDIGTNCRRNTQRDWRAGTGASLAQTWRSLPTTYTCSRRCSLSLS
eukprot:2117899-Pyramimonas_sp.AAC.1